MVIQGSFLYRLFLALSNIINRSDGHYEALLFQLFNRIFSFPLVDLVVREVYYAEGGDSGPIVEECGQSLVSELIESEI